VKPNTNNIAVTKTASLFIFASFSCFPSPSDSRKVKLHALKGGTYGALAGRRPFSHLSHEDKKLLHNKNIFTVIFNSRELS